MGAIVALYDSRDRILDRAITNEGGSFSFGGLIPNLYSLRVTLSSFLPAVRDGIKVQAGTRRVLDVNLSSLFSSIQFGPIDGGQRGMMSDDWKWTVRSSGSTRPILRLTPTHPVAFHAPAFSDSRGLGSSLWRRF